MEEKIVVFPKSKEETDRPILFEEIDKKSFLQSVDNLSSSDIRESIYRYALIVVFAAAAVGSSAALLFIPNLETITLFIFLIAFVYGYRTGFAMMITTAFVFEFFASTVYGVATYLLPFKLVSYSITVITAAFIGKIYYNEQNNAKRIEDSLSIPNKVQTKILFAFIGLILTLIYDMITVTSIFLFYSSTDAFFVLFITGIPWYLFHETTNALLFTLIPTLAGFMFYSNPLKENTSNSSNAT